ncbi:MAG: hypothetical protein ACKO6N_24000 [Myxococcota bacterium]
MNLHHLRVLGGMVGLLLLPACLNQDVHYYEVQMTGSIEAPAHPDSTEIVYLTVYHAVSGEDMLAHPLEFIGSTEALLGTLDYAFLYPLDNGEGLVVFGWLDVDGDGIYCTAQETREDVGGLVEVTDFPAHSVSLRLSLTEACTGPEGLYPK